jgi:hypothetical protein
MFLWADSSIQRNMRKIDPNPAYSPAGDRRRLTALVDVHLARRGVCRIHTGNRCAERMGGWDIWHVYWLLGPIAVPLLELSNVFKPIVKSKNYFRYAEFLACTYEEGKRRDRNFRGLLVLSASTCHNFSRLPIGLISNFPGS